MYIVLCTSFYAELTLQFKDFKLCYYFTYSELVRLIYEIAYSDVVTVKQEGQVWGERGLRYILC
jgi:hypothetical protein